MDILGSSILSPAHGKGGARATTNIIILSTKNRAKPKQTGKKERGLGEGIFARLLCPAKRDWGWEATAHSASAEEQSRKFFFFKGKNKKEMACAKIIEKIFCFARRQASAAAGWDCRPTGGNQKSVSGFSLKKVRISSKTRSHIFRYELGILR
jgi:hypothetical protein